MNTRSELTYPSLDGTQLNAVHESPEGPIKGLVLMTHGLPSDKEEGGFYTRMAERLSTGGYASLRFDFRGCNDDPESALPNLAPASLLMDMEASRAILLGLHPPGMPLHLVATSASGGIAIYWVLSSRHGVASVNLMAPVLDYWMECVGTRRPSTGLPQLNSEELAELQHTGVLRAGEGYGREFIEQARFLPVPHLSASLASRILVFHGTADSLVPIDISRSFVHDNPGARLLEMEGCDHGFAAPGDDELTFPETLNNHEVVYRSLLKRLDQGGGSDSDGHEDA